MHSPALSRKPRLHELVAISIDLVPSDQPLEFPLYVKVAGAPVLFRPEGDTLTAERATRLKQRTSNLFVPHERFGRFLDKIEGVSGGHAGLSLSMRLGDLLSSLADGFTKSREHQARTLKQIEAFSDRLAELLIKDPANAGLLIRKSDESELYFTNHNLNVALYSALIGIKQGLDFKALKTLVLGAILHNVGNIFVSPSILYKRAALDRREREQIHSHPVSGAELLSRMKAPQEVVQMVLQHHECMDGRGYPHGVSGRKISLFARICSIADVFDALTSHRPYRQAVDAETAIVMMRGMVGKFDPEILKTFDK